MGEYIFPDATRYANLRISQLSLSSSTLYEPGDAIAPDPYYYDETAELLMRERGIVLDNETVASSLNRATDALLTIDNAIEGRSDEAFEKKTRSYIEQGVIVYGTPILANAGRERATTAACTVLPLKNVNGKIDLNHFTSSSYEALSKAIGTGYDLSDLDEPAAALQELNTALDTINKQLLGQNKRPVASMATLRADHPDVLNFVRAKRDVDFAKWRFNISLFASDKLFNAAEENGTWDLKDANGMTVDTIEARFLLQEIADCAHYCGEPGLLFRDRIDEDNPTPQWEYTSTAPCAEVAMSEGEACQFSYINLGALVDAENNFDRQTFGEAVEVLTRLLDDSVEMTIQNSHDLPLVYEKRRIGVGITGFADLLIRMQLPYDSPESTELAGAISELLDYHSKYASMDLAQRRGAFPAFNQSRFTDPDWLRRKSLRPSVGAVQPESWSELYDNIERYGIRNASTTSLPPTGTSSTIVGASKSLEPVFSLLDRDGRLIKPVAEIAQAHNPELTNALGAIGIGGMLPDGLLQSFPFLRTARQLDTTAHLAVQEGFQAFLDESLAKTVNVDRSASVDDILSIFKAAHQGGLKGITVFRDNCLAERTLNQADIAS